MEHVELPQTHTSIVGKIIAYLIQHNHLALTQCAHILDLRCGMASEISDLQTMFPDASISAFDKNAVKINYAEKVYQACPRVKLHHLDINDAAWTHLPQGNLIIIKKPHLNRTTDTHKNPTPIVNWCEKIVRTQKHGTYICIVMKHHDAVSFLSGTDGHRS
jgi:hypothetical protein